MTTVGRLMGDIQVTRWGFESNGNALGLGERGGPGSDGFATTFSGTIAQDWAVLAMISVTMIAGTILVLRRRSLFAEGR